MSITIFFQKRRERYYQQHKKEINYYRKCERELKQHLDKNGKVPTARWKREKEELQAGIEELKADNQPYQEELTFVKKRYRAVRILPDVTGKWQKQILPGVQKKKKGEAGEVPGHFTQFRRKRFLKKTGKQSNSR